MSYLLDTNVCIAIINDRPVKVRKAFRHAVGRGEAIAVSSVTVFELWYGAVKSARPEANAERLEVFLVKPVVLPFDDEDARAAGLIRATLEKAGTPIGAYDLLIAGQALQRNLTLVTANLAEFRRVGGLRWENWAA